MRGVKWNRVTVLLFLKVTGLVLANLCPKPLIDKCARIAHNNKITLKKKTLEMLKVHHCHEIGRQKRKNLEKLLLRV